ncbi:MAG: hypothetical protein IT288_15105 [Bdellovibrionales bacterium]|nr:hypothetical protein [Bdellovibrionales bacterium]
MPYTIFGFGLGVCFGYAKARLDLRTIFHFLPFQFLIFLGLLLVGLTEEPTKMVFAIMLVPFGAIASLGFQATDTHRFFAADLVGGLAGILFAVTGFKVLSLETILILFSLLAGVVSLLGRNTTLARKKWLLLGLAISLGLMALQATTPGINLMKLTRNIHNPEVDAPGSLRNCHQAIRAGNAELLFSRWSVIERVDVLKNLKTGRLFLCFSNVYWSDVASAANDATPGVFEPLRPFDSLLSIGPGGGVELMLAKNAGATSLVGAELNDATVSLMKNELAEVSNQLFNSSDIFEGDGRSYLRQTSRKFDVISLFGVDSPLHSSNTTKKDYLITSEGIGEIIRHLNSYGTLVYRANYDLQYTPIKLFQFLFGSFIEIERNQKSKPNLHIAMISRLKKAHNKDQPKQFTAFVYVSKKPLPSQFIARFRDTARDMNYKVLYTPPTTETSSQTDEADEPEFFPQELELQKALSMPNFDALSRHLHRTFPFFTASSDNKPFVNVHATRELLTKVALPLVTMALGLLVLLLLAPMSVKELRNKQTWARRFNSQQVIYLGSLGILGLTYGFVQLTVLNLFERIFSSPILLIGIVLSAQLLAGSLAALATRRWTLKCIAGLFLMYPLMVGLLFARYDWVLNHSSLPSTSLLFGGYVFLMTWFGSLPFAKFLDLGKAEQPEALSLLFGVNSVLMGIGSFLPLLVLVFWDTTALKVVAVIGIVTSSILVFGALMWLSRSNKKPAEELLPV